MKKIKIIGGLFFVLTLFSFLSCGVPKVISKTENKTTPGSFKGLTDTSNSAKIKWSGFFKDKNLLTLIDSALKKNQELKIVSQEIDLARNQILNRKGAYLPFLKGGTDNSIEKVGRYTSQGANDANTEILPGREMPDPLSDLNLSLNAIWEIDIWKKLRNAKNSAVEKYLGTIDGRNFLITQLISEIANSYYELMALDNQLEILEKNLEIQQNALEIVRLEKAAARVTELAVKKFEAEVLKNQSRRFQILQQIIETENRINFLTGRFPQPVTRNSKDFLATQPDSLQTGIPSQLLLNRPDIRRAEHELTATKFELKSARAEFYPSLTIKSGIGFQAFNVKYLLEAPQSLMYSLAGDLIGPIINRTAIKANFLNANAKQIQAAYEYERSILNGFTEVSNQLANINNLKNNFNFKEKQVQALVESIEISNLLFKSARADYMEVLMTQRDALEAKFELIETKKQQMNAMVNMYKALGGGWQ